MAIILDSSHLISRLAFACKKDIIERPEYLSHIFFNSLLMNARKFGAAKDNPVILALDSKPYWRHKYYTENKDQFLEYKTNPKFQKYKGQREKDESLPWDKVWEVANACFESVERHSDFHVVGVTGAEADDVIAIGTRYYREKGQPVTVVSSDKDFQQIHEPARGVQVWDPIKKAFRPDIDPRFYKNLHAISGDPGDNILPIRKGAGPNTKTAERIARDLDTYLATDAELRARFEFNRVLTDFDYIPEEVSGRIITALENHVHTFAPMELMKTFIKYRLNAIGERVQEFKLPEHMPVKQSTAAKTFKEADKIKQIHDNTLEAFFG